MLAGYDNLKDALRAASFAGADAPEWLSGRLALVLGWVIAGWPATAAEADVARLCLQSPDLARELGWKGVATMTRGRLLRNGDKLGELTDALKACSPDREVLCDLGQLFAVTFNDQTPESDALIAAVVKGLGLALDRDGDDWCVSDPA